MVEDEAVWYHEKTSNYKGLAPNLGIAVDRNTLVRESIQNSEDEAIDGEVCNVTVKLISLSGKDRDRLYELLKIKELKKHINCFDFENPRLTTHKTEILDCLKRKKVNILVIEDENTTGLKGGDEVKYFGPDNKFWALTKAEYLSFKNNFYGNAQGGSYGAGKQVLWRNAGSTVVAFSSTLQNNDLPKGKENPRFIAKADGPSHIMKKGSSRRIYFGPGHLCIPEESDTDDHTEIKSVWGSEAEKLASSIGISREGMKSGTSVAVIGYEGEAQGFSEFKPEDEFRELVNQASINFWRKIENKKLRIKVQRFNALPSETAPIEEEEVKVIPEIEVFAGMYREYMEGDFDLINEKATVKIGKLVVREISTKSNKLPQTLRGASEQNKSMNSSIDLLIFVPKEDQEINETYLDHTLMFREGGPVITYHQMKNKEIGANFYAILIGGDARSRKNKGNKEMEAYLKYCEDEGHTNWFWHAKTQLRFFYESPFEGARNELQANYESALKKYIVGSVKEGSPAPRNLMKRFKFGTEGPVKPKSGLAILSGRKDGARWEFNARVERKTEDDTEWKARIVVSYKADTGRTAGNIPIEKVDFGPMGAPVDVLHKLDKKGCLILHCPPSISSLEFFGTTAETEIEGKMDRILVRHTALEV